MIKLKVTFIDAQNSVKLPSGIRILLRRACTAVLDYENFEHNAEVTVNFVDDELIREYNKKFRNIDKSTDVLSFPMLEYHTPADFSFLDEESSDDFNPDTGEAMLGDIIISVDKVLEQAESYGHSIEREYAFLITHSMLHLFGFDHMEETEREVMEEKQREILSVLNILR